MKHQESQKRHAIKRAYQRYGVVLTDEKYDKLLSLTKNGFASTVLIQTNNSLIKTIDFEGNKLFFVFDKRNQTIVTFLTFETVKRYCGQTNKKKEKTKGQTVLIRNKIGELISWDEKLKTALVLVKSANKTFYGNYNEINFIPTETEINLFSKKEAQKDLTNKIVKTKYGLAVIIAELKNKTVLRLKLLNTERVVHVKHSAIVFLEET